MTRKLATVQEIAEIEPIKGADRIEKVQIKGWSCVTGKGDFHKGDLCVYFEVDSVLPIQERYEFLRKGCWNEQCQGFRLRTVKLRKQISQGLALPLSIFPEISRSEITEIGFDLTEKLGVRKYEPKLPECLVGSVRGNFPDFIPKTDEERVQNMPKTLTAFEGKEVYVTEKLDGASATYYVRDDIFGVCSRNLDLEESKNTYWKIAKKYDLKEKMMKLGINFAIQGEILGPKIQGNKYELIDCEFRVFNVFFIDDYRPSDLQQLRSITEELKLQTVPVIEIINNNHSRGEWIKRSEGRSVINTKIEREGIVIRTVECKDNNKLSFKCINPHFLLAQHKT